MIKDKVYSLSKIDLLSDLSTSELEELSSDFLWENYSQGSEIIKQGQEEHAFYILIEGKANVMIWKEGDRARRVRSLGPGDTFGEFSLLDGKTAATTILCQENCQVLMMDSEGFARMLLRWPKLYQTFIGRLTQNLNEANLILSEVKYKEVLRSALQLTQYKDKFYGLWGGARTTSEVERQLKELSEPKGHLLLTGERGTGRQMMAWYVHQRQSGPEAPFVVVDGGRFDQQWKGLITEPAVENKTLENANLFDIAEGGTLFIREINLISPQTQLQLARSIDFKKSKCFVIGSINLEKDEQERGIIPELRKCFAHTYEIPPLRKRKRDIPILAQGFLEKLAQKNQRKVPILNQEATQLLLSHHYRQGNVSELIQVIERAFHIADQDVIGLEQIFFGPTAEQNGYTINLLSWPKLKEVLQKGVLLGRLRGTAAILFIAMILLLLFDPQVAVSTKLFTLVWGLWWPALALISPFLGRVWCTVCPFSTIMDFVQKRLHKNYGIPKLIIEYDYILMSLLFLLIFWIEVISDMRYKPIYTAMLLIAIQVFAVVIGIFFPRHTWCRHFCPLGGFIGIASVGSMLEVRADPSVCLNKCITFDCYVGTKRVSGCPMSQHLPFLDNNLDCKLCFNCVRNCPNGSVQVNLRLAGREVWHLVRVNQGFVVFIGVMLGILVPLNYFVTFRQVEVLSAGKVWFSLCFWGAGLIGGMLAWLLSKPFKTKAASLRVKIVFAFTPLVLAGHIMYQISFVPGIRQLFFGVGYDAQTGALFLHIPAIVLARGIVTAFGLVLTGVTIALVLLRTKGKGAASFKA
ncbi:response regulator with CheY-like receiver, AAA-type ATPase, and DNA-binding domains [Desulfosporosinus orientis DSM 765]|uniref:Response regulator with CheY-like receiver, AAA-type ATPase, and DNA-binding domains n=1 Tax=Desulfosporosinus orientis (strain ATCC 19365 / DSM 765 / NCIMB 8382 / VKM B-1628 / Singapore I) TaxID=768706 RepID=G7WH31_DESOD|nr:cyclic nucleotide-binding domain-containing protein [Desulfosporosinus orientis]AET69539.1 response regulator with CheY-like receiver, AAA-type ATPase, and DNA-binding domains [Desulfosporosinus orientis DSM 765]